MDVGGGWTQVEASSSKKKKSTPLNNNKDSVNHHQFMIVLCGKPGSGKSVWSCQLVDLAPTIFERISQDELGSRQKCISRTEQALRKGRCPIIDRCNFDATQRLHFLELAATARKQQHAVPVHCIVFDVSPKVCIQRCRERSNHPTLAPTSAAGVVKKMQRSWRDPTEDEGFSSIKFVRNNKDLRQASELFLTLARQQS